MDRNRSRCTLIAPDRSFDPFASRTRKTAGKRAPVPPWRCALWILVFWMMLAPGAQAQDAQTEAGETAALAGQPWQVTADSVSYDDDAKQYIGKGNVTISGRGKELTADFVRFDHKTMDAEAVGNVTLTSGKDVLTGSRMEINLDSETGTVYDGSVFFEKNHFYINGDTIEKLGDKTYAADWATVTSCDGDNPAWKISGRNIKATSGGVGFADHATFWAKGLPVMYFPMVAFPVNRERQSGLLFPEFGAGERRGFEVNLPYFWAINDNSDATFFAHYMEKRGLRYGGEYRYKLSELSQGAAMMDYLDDRQIDDGTEENKNYGFQEDDVPRLNHDRYWFRMKHDQELPWEFTGKLDIDWVSDQDYLLEFMRGQNGFNESNDYFSKQFGRDLDPYDDAVRLNRLNVNRSWEMFSFNAEARWYDDVINRQLNDTNTVLQQLPFATFDASKQQLFSTPLYGRLNTNYVRYYQEDSTRAHTIDIYPRVFLPTNLGHYLSFEPSVGFRETAWYEESGYWSETGGDDLQDRQLYDLQVDLSSEVYRVFDFNRGSLKKVKHSFRPRLIYNYIPEEDQSDIPYYIASVPETNRINYQLINILTTKSLVTPEKTISETKKKPPTKTDETADPSLYDYREFVRLTISGYYDIREATTDDPTERIDPDERQPWSPMYVELNFAPSRYISLRG
ncbi:MAG: LPS assembly protein LptD, partial [Desulfobacteraceae bacterium]|nr:LPS assembly protein LptD [Desulfobacteraceae bacterium]